LIGGFLERLRCFGSKFEIIVVDGGSDDGTPELSTGLADYVLKVPPGRARQMNAGAQVAQGDVFWFLHADSVIPSDAPTEIQQCLDNGSNVGGCFRLRFPSPRWIYRVSDSLGNIGVEVFGFALGDHGIFCRREAFFQAGGFPDIPLMEDAEFYRALRRWGRVRQLRTAIIANPRKYEQFGPYRTTIYYAVILALYCLKARISTLLTVYRRLGDNRRTLTCHHSANLAGSASPDIVRRSTTLPSGLRQ
jgi:rSAM/selenodomain-associated transferase 2